MEGNNVVGNFVGACEGEFEGNTVFNSFGENVGLIVGNTSI